MHLAAVHIHADLSRCHVDVAIEHLGVAIHRRMVAAIENDAVRRAEFHHMVQVHTLTHKPARVARQRRRCGFGRVTICLNDRVDQGRDIDHVT